MHRAHRLANSPSVSLRLHDAGPLAAVGAAGLAHGRVSGQALQTIAIVGTVISMASGAACAYHGYKRNNSSWWAVGWFFFGYSMPILAIPIALAQGFGQPATSE